MALLALSALLVLPAADARAAVVEEWSVDLEIRRDAIIETLYWRVLVEDQDDVHAWSELPVYLDEHRELLSAEAWVTSPDGDRRKLRRKERDLRDVSLSWELRSSRQFLVFAPDGLVPGGRLEVRAQISETPYYPGTVVSLRPSADPFAKVEIAVRHAPDVEGFRHALHGRTTLPDAGSEEDSGAARNPGLRPQGLRLQGLRLQDLGDTLFLSGSWPTQRPVSAPAAAQAAEPVLYLAWNTPDDWGGVARWYRGLLQQLPPVSATVREQARRLVTGLPSDDVRARLEALVAFVRSKVRYVAVEVGVGGYRPSPSGETLERLWGDCKDKSLLLIDLLRDAGIEAHPALVRLGADGRIRTDFPSPFDFNHLIVAVRAEGLPTHAGDPVAEGFFFVDPTQNTGSAGYLHSAVQDQSALVVLPSGGRLVRTPILPDSRRTELHVDLDVQAEGRASGTARLLFEGDFGSAFAQDTGSRPPNEIEDQMRSLLRRILPGARVPSLEWTGNTDGIPRFEVRAHVEFQSLVAGLDRGGSVKVDGFQWAPEPSDLDRIEDLPASVPAAHVENTFRLTLPESFCPPKPRETRLDNAAGTFEQQVTVQGSTVEILRRTRAKAAWFTDDHLTALKELALEEHRAPKRRLRFRCR